jgi:hydroxymethylglutaryl-CoA lyase
MFENLPSNVRIIEVGPRDGLQNCSVILATETKFSLVRQLVAAGIREIELTSFVRPDLIPQLADAAILVEKIRGEPLLFKDVNFTCLVPNLRGIEAAYSAGITDVAVFIAASEGFSKANINVSIAESLERVDSVLAFAKARKMRVRGYLSTVFGCPYEGEVPVSQVVRLTKELLRMGVYEVSLGDTTGIGTPLQVDRLFKNLRLGGVSPHEIAMHFHDTKGFGLANVIVALDAGITAFDSSVGGLGGCPFAPGSAGNVSTNSVVSLLGDMGIRTGIDKDILGSVATFITKLVRPSV